MELLNEKQKANGCKLCEKRHNNSPSPEYKICPITHSFPHEAEGRCDESGRRVALGILVQGRAHGILFGAAGRVRVVLVMTRVTAKRGYKGE